VAALSVVAAQEAVQRPDPLVVVGPAAAVGPLGEQRPVEPFGFAVGPGAVRLDVAALDLQRVADSDPVAGGQVVLGVVGQDSSDRDAVLVVEPLRGAVEEPGAGRSLLVGQDFAVGDPAAVIDRDVDVVPAGPAAAGRRGPPAVQAPPTALSLDPPLW